MSVTAGRRALGIVSALTLFAVALCACDGSSGEIHQAVSLSLYTDPASDDPFEGVDFIVLSAEGPGVSGDIYQTVPFTAQGAAALDGIPYGARQVAVEGWSATEEGELEQVLSRGRSLIIDVKPSSVGEVLSVLFARVNAFISLVSSSTGEAQRLSEGRVGHTVVPSSSGKILVSGGFQPLQTGVAWWREEAVGDASAVQILSSVDIIHEASGSLTTLEDGMCYRRAWHASAGLDGGITLVCGGVGNAVEGEDACSNKATDVDQALPSCEVFYPDTGSMEVLTNELMKPRYGHTMTLIDPTGFRFLVVGGDVDGQGTYEIWSPATGSEGLVDLPDARIRRFHQATLFDVPGRQEPAVLITGGETDTEVLGSVLVFDLASYAADPLGAMIPVGDVMEKGARTMHTATWVADRGYIYVVGGYTSVDRTGVSDAIDVYDAQSLSFIPMNFTANLRLNTARGGHTATALDGNALILAGGASDDGSALSSVEFIHEYQLVDEATGESQLKIDVVASCTGSDCAYVPYMDQGRFGVRAVTLQGGMVALIGGASGGAAQALNVGDATAPGARRIRLYNPPSL